jgi:hypothetical protein
VPINEHVEEVLLPGAELNGAVGGRDKHACREEDGRTVGRAEDILPCVRLGGGAEIAGNGQDVRDGIMLGS